MINFVNKFYKNKSYKFPYYTNEPAIKIEHLKEYVNTRDNNLVKVVIDADSTCFKEYVGDNTIAWLLMSHEGFKLGSVQFYDKKTLVHIKIFSEKELMAYNGISESCNRLKGYAREALKIKKDMNDKINYLYGRYEEREKMIQKIHLEVLDELENKTIKKTKI